MHCRRDRCASLNRFRQSAETACCVHTQNKRRCLALMVAHGDPTPSLAAFTASASRSLRPYCALHHAFILFGRSGSAG